MKIETIAVADLSLDPSNVRKHSRRNLDAIKASLRKFGQQKPIVVDAKGIVLAGNGTLTAAKELGWTEIQATRTELAGVEATAFAIADNRTAELAEWDEDGLAKVLESLKVEDADLLAATGYDDAEVDKMVGTEVTEDEAPEPPAEPITKAGDLWLLGDHRVLCGDSTKAEDVARVMNRERAGAVVTDPPYGINANKQTLGAGKKQFDRGGDWDAKTPDVTSLTNLADQVVIWGGNYFADQLPPTNHWLCWHKHNDGRSFSEFELAWTTLGHNCRHLSHHWSREQKAHPTQKPVKVMAWCAQMTEGIIYDPFLGSGTTLIAAEQLGRKCYGMEISPAYCDVIVKRWENLTGKKAVLENRIQ